MGDLFSHVQVARQREDTGLKFIKVPITYASKERFMANLGKWTAVQNIPNPNMSPKERAEQKAKVETVLPRMNLQMVDMLYNSQYKTALQNRTQIQFENGDPRKRVSQYSPTPVKMIFELGIYTRTQDDMFQIVEQIMPYFQPHFNTTMWEQFGNDIPFKRDIRIVLQSISMDEQIDGDSISRRRLEWSLMFEVNGWMYPPVEDIEGEIRTTYIDFHANSRNLGDSSDIYESVDTEVVPRDIDPEDWDGESKQTMSTGIPIPVAPQPPAPRGK